VNSIDLAGRRAVVTGAARGIGLAITERLLQSGAAVALWDVDDAALARAETSLAGAGTFAKVQADVTKPAQVAAAVAQSRAALGGIDILVNNAGIAGPNKKTWEYEPAEWDAVLALDLTGVFLCCRAIAPLLRAQGYGRIVNIASIAGKEGNPNAPAYSAAKAGVMQLTTTLLVASSLPSDLVSAMTPAFEAL